LRLSRYTPGLMRLLFLASALTLIVAAGTPVARQSPYRTLNDTFDAPRFTDAEQWRKRAAHLREHILVSAGLVPMPERTPLRPEIFGEIKHTDYSVAKAYFESLPGFFVTGNLYRPIGDGPFPAILTPHGHWAYGRLENTSLNSVPGRAISLARQGFVVFTYDMVGYGDSRQLPHTFGGRRESLWGLSLAGLQLWNAIRGLDFLETLPYVKRDALGATGESGGGTQTFLLAAVDDRVRVAAPVNMISLHMQGGCLCENPPGLRLDTTNVEIAATIAPRPLLMIAATGDWTKNTLEREYPAVRAIYTLMDAPDRVHSVRFDAEHNYNRESREAMYAWMARWLKQAPADVRIAERSFTPEAPADLLVFHQRPLPANAVTAEQLTRNWIEAAKQHLATTDVKTLGRALHHVLGFGDVPTLPSIKARSSGRTVLLAGADATLERQLRDAKLTVRQIVFTPFDAPATEKIRHFETYNRTAAAQRVADIVAAMRAHPGAALVANGDAALAALLAAAIAPPRIAVLDVGGHRPPPGADYIAPGIDGFDTSDDDDYVDRLYIPGLRRAGGLQTAATLAGERIVIHNAGKRFALAAPTLQHEPLSANEIVRLILVRSK
jgi:dienelactone hydrolase